MVEEEDRRESRREEEGMDRMKGKICYGGLWGGGRSAER